MLGNEAHANTPLEALRAAAYSAGANNGPWIDVKDLVGTLEFIYNVGAVTGGTITFKLQDATDSGGSGAADLSPAVATSALNTAGGTGKLLIHQNKIRSHVRIVGTVATGPIDAAAVFVARSRNV